MGRDKKEKKGRREEGENEDMDDRILAVIRLDQIAREVSESGIFTYEDATSAVNRCFKFYRDTGEQDPEALSKTIEMIGMAADTAPRIGFDLRATVDHIILSIFHRVPSGSGYVYRNKPLHKHA